MATCIEITIPDNERDESFTKDDRVVSSISMFEVSRLATLYCEHYLKAICSLPSSHIVIDMTSKNGIIFFDGVKGIVTELSLKVPEFLQRGKGPQKTVWITLSGPVSSYKQSGDLVEAIKNTSASGVAEFLLDGFAIAFKPKSNVLYVFTREPGSSNTFYNLITEGIFIHIRTYSVRGYKSVTMTSSFALALSTNECLDIFETKTLFKDCTFYYLCLLMNDIVCSVDCIKNSKFLRYDSALSVMSFVEIDDRQLALKVITEAIPDLKVEKLISMKKFDEALELAKKFSVSFDPIYKDKASDLLDKINNSSSNNMDDATTLYSILKKTKDQDAFCDLCFKGILSLNMFSVVKKLLDMTLDTRTKNCYIVEQLNSISATFTTPEFNNRITKESASKILKVFSFIALDKNFRSDLMKFMEKDFMPYVLMLNGSRIGCAYAEALVKVIDSLEYEEGEDYSSIAYCISLSLDSISKCLKERALTPSEKCLFVDIRTSMGFDSYNERNVLGTLNMRKENLLKIVQLKKHFNLLLKYNEFIRLSNEDICVYIVEKMLLMEDEMETIYLGVLKPYCQEYVLDRKSLICDFVGKWSAKQTFITGNDRVGMLKNKVSLICKLVRKIIHSILQIGCLQDLADAVPYN
uniref:J domain-containing protein n=1 Tax=Strongyloides venezuelensis TaxID=75913 RepID=A0A0K0FKY2_STRVS